MGLETTTTVGGVFRGRGRCSCGAGTPRCRRGRLRGRSRSACSRRTARSATRPGTPFTVTEPASSACGDAVRARRRRGCARRRRARSRCRWPWRRPRPRREAQDREHRAEHLVAGEVAVVVDVAEHRRRDEVARPRARPPSRSPPVRSSAPSRRARVDHAEDALARGRGDDRADHDAGVERVADRQRLDVRDDAASTTSSYTSSCT